MIYFDRQTLKILRYIKKSKGVSWDEMQNKFGRDLANIFLLESLSVELYTVTKDQNENWIDFKVSDHHLNGSFRSFTTPKANEIIEAKVFDFWKWVVPTIISVIALAVSALTA